MTKTTIGKATSTRSTLQLTTEARDIADQILSKFMNLSSNDSEMLKQVLKSTIGELESVVKDLDRNKAPKELSGIPATLALLSAMTIMRIDPKIGEQFSAYLKSMEKL